MRESIPLLLFALSFGMIEYSFCTDNNPKEYSVKALFIGYSYDRPVVLCKHKKLQNKSDILFMVLQGPENESKQSFFKGIKPGQGVEIKLKEEYIPGETMANPAAAYAPMPPSWKYTYLKGKIVKEITKSFTFSGRVAEWKDGREGMELELKKINNWDIIDAMLFKSSVYWSFSKESLIGYPDKDYELMRKIYQEYQNAEIYADQKGGGKRKIGKPFYITITASPVIDGFKITSINKNPDN